MKFPAQPTYPNDIDLNAWATESQRKQQLIRTIMVNSHTGEMVELRCCNPNFLAQAFLSGVMLKDIS